MMKEANILFLLLPLVSGCVAGAGFDRAGEHRAATEWGSDTVSPVIQVSTDPVERHTYEYKPTEPFDGSLHRSKGVLNTEASVPGTDYRVTYRDRRLTINRDQGIVVSERLPAVYQMHPLFSAVLLGSTPTEDVIVCSIRSRASTRCHLILLYDGSGRELFVRTFDSATVSDIQIHGDDQIIVGGPMSETILKVDRNALKAEQSSRLVPK